MTSETNDDFGDLETGLTESHRRQEKNYSEISDDYTHKKNKSKRGIFNGEERTRRQQSHTNHQGTIEINRLLGLLNSQSASRGRRKEEKVTDWLTLREVMYKKNFRRHMMMWPELPVKQKLITVEFVHDYMSLVTLKYIETMYIK